MSENLKNDILQVVKSQKKNTDCSNIVKATELRPPQKSVYSKQARNFKEPQVLNENAGDVSDGEWFYAKLIWKNIVREKYIKFWEPVG